MLLCNLAIKIYYKSQLLLYKNKSLVFINLFLLYNFNNQLAIFLILLYLNNNIYIKYKIYIK